MKDHIAIFKGMVKCTGDCWGEHVDCRQCQKPDNNENRCIHYRKNMDGVCDNPQVLNMILAKMKNE